MLQPVGEPMEFALNSYFIHRQLLLTALSSLQSTALQSALLQAESLAPPMNNLFAERELMRAAESCLKRQNVHSLEELLLTGVAEVGSLVTLCRAVYFRGVAKAHGERSQGKLAYGEFSIKLPELNGLEIEGKLNPEHLINSTARTKLSGKSVVFIFAHISEIEDDHVRLRPIVIADRVLRNAEVEMFSGLPNPGLVQPEDIDEFQKLLPTGQKLNLDDLREISEADTKKALAEIIGETDIPKDWGGEKSDLYTTRLHVKGERVRAAFLLKGPAAFHKMKMKDLGKNGDQIVRLFEEPAELLILQHCHEISPPVLKTMEAFAYRFSNPRHYCVIDGFDTLRILKGNGKL